MDGACGTVRGTTGSVMVGACESALAWGVGVVLPGADGGRISTRKR